MTWTKPISVWLAPALVLALGVLVILGDGFTIPTRLGNTLFDAYQRHLPPQDDAALRVEPLDLPVMDEETLARLTTKLTAAGASVLAFTTPPDTAPSPLALAARLPPGSDAARAALAKMPEPGHDLAVAIHETKAVVPVTLGTPGRSPHIVARFVYRGVNNPFARVPRFASGTASAAILESNATGSAAINLPLDHDGVLRRLPIAFHLGTALVPGMATEIARASQDKNDITVTSDERNPLTFFAGVGIAGLELDGRVIPADRDGGVRLRFAPPQEKRLDAATLGAARLDGLIAVIGPAGQMMQTPLGPDTVAGVMAQGVKHLLSGAVLARPSWMPLLEGFTLLLLGACMIGALRFGLGWAAAAVMVSVTLFFLLSWYLFARHGVLLDAASPMLGLTLAFAAGAIAYVNDLRLAYAGLRVAFSDSLPRASIEKIARKPSLLRIEGETRNITYLVCGVRGLAALAATYRDDPAGFTSLMQRVLTPLIDQALAHGGTIDRLTADGFAAFWNAPLDDADHAQHACESANGMAIMAARVTEELSLLEKDGVALPVVEIGVGIATGNAIAGGFGGAGRMGYSVNGDAVALAQRIQALSHQYGPALIVAQETRRVAERGFAFLEVDTIAAGLSDPPVTISAIMGNPVMRASPKFRALTVFHDHIFQAIRKQQWDRARELIAQCRRLSGASQKMYDLHLARIAWYEKHPPGETWDGAFRPVLE